MGRLASRPCCPGVSPIRTACISTAALTILAKSFVCNLWQWRNLSCRRSGSPMSLRSGLASPGEIWPVGPASDSDFGSSSGTSVTNPGETSKRGL